MALQEVTAAFLRRFRAANGPLASASQLQCRHYATGSTSTSEDLGDLDQTGFLGSDERVVDTQAYNPVEIAKKRNRRLPRSRYQVRPPKYYRGPLHPIQPPKPADPSSRLFKPGPFSLPRLEQTYHDTFASDFMTLSYSHFPPGTGPHQKGERLRSWVGDSPYFKNRPLRGPRGYEVLPVLRKPITFRNVPRLTGVTVHSMVKEARTNSSYLHVAGMALQAITGVRATPHAIRKGVAGFEIRPGQHLSVSCNLEGEDMYHFLSKVIDIVMPKIKDFRGIKGSTGDSSGNLAFGLTGEQVALFPEIEVNYDSYPAKMIPGCHIFIKTSAANDRDARVFLSQLGFPFYGKMVN